MESLASEFYTQHCWWIQAGQWSPNLNFLLAALEKKGCLGDIKIRTFIITLMFKAKLFLWSMSRKKNVNNRMIRIVARNYVADNRLFQAAVASKIGMVEGT